MLCGRGGPEERSKSVYTEASRLRAARLAALGPGWLLRLRGSISGASANGRAAVERSLNVIEGAGWRDADRRETGYVAVCGAFFHFDVGRRIYSMTGAIDPERR